MRGRESPPQTSLFYTGINLDKRVRSGHVVRKVARLVDFDFVYTEVKGSYGYNGNASVVRKGEGKADLGQQTHRGIDGAYGVITATVVGPGDENEAHRLGDLLEYHRANTECDVEVVVADSTYVTTAHFLECYERGVLAHIAVLKQSQDQQERRRKIFPENAFVYDSQTDTYRCPAGQALKRRKHWVERKAFEYVPPAVSVGSVLYESNALARKVVAERSNGTSATRFWTGYVFTPRADRLKEIS